MMENIGLPIVTQLTPQSALVHYACAGNPVGKFDLNICGCTKTSIIDIGTCTSSPDGLSLGTCKPSDEQVKLNTSLGCKIFQAYKTDGEKCKGTCRQGTMFDWNSCECAPEGQVDKVRCTSPPDALHLGTGSPTGSGEVFAASSGCQNFFQKSGSGWFEMSWSANLLFDLDQCICDFPYNVNSSTCRSKSAVKRLLDFELAAELAKLL